MSRSDFPILEVSGLEGGYGKVQIMNNVDLYVD